MYKEQYCMSISWILSTTNSEKLVKALIIATTRSWIQVILPKKKRKKKIKSNTT